jgi:hypothetical protein
VVLALFLAVDRARGFAVERARVAVPPRLEPLLDDRRDVRLRALDDLVFDDRAFDDRAFDDLAEPDDLVDPEDLVDPDDLVDDDRFVLVFVWATDLSSVRFRSGSGYPTFNRVIEMHGSLRTVSLSGTRRRTIGL